MSAMGKVDPPKVPSLFDVTIEQSLIGCVMQNNIDFWKVSEIIQPDDFFDPFHGRIWAKISDMVGKDVRADAKTLRAAFANDPATAELGTDYVVSLMLAAPAMGPVKDYARITANYARRRRIVEAASNAIDRAYADEGTPDEIADEAAEAIYEATHSNEPGQGPESLDAAIDRAIQIAERAHTTPHKARVLTGLPSLDAALGGLFPRDLTTLGAAPSQGKSALGAQIGLAAARNAYRVLVFSIEMAAEEWVLRYIAQEAGVPADKILEGRTSPKEMEAIALAREAFHGLPYKLDGSKVITAAQIRARAQAMRRREGLDLIVVDHLKHVRPANIRDPFTEQMNQITRDLKATASDLGVACLLISHLNREFWGRTSHRPLVSDLYGSSAIEQNSDHIWFLHREEYYLEREAPPEHDEKAYQAWMKASLDAKGRAEIFSAKRRMGKVGSARVLFDGPFVRFSEEGA